MNQTSMKSYLKCYSQLSHYPLIPKSYQQIFSRQPQYSIKTKGYEN